MSAFSNTATATNKNEVLDKALAKLKSHDLGLDELPDASTDTWLAFKAYGFSLAEQLALTAYKARLAGPDPKNNTLSPVNSDVSTPSKSSIGTTSGAATSSNPGSAYSSVPSGSASKARPHENFRSKLTRTVGMELEWINNFGRTLQLQVNNKQVTTSAAFVQAAEDATVDNFGTITSAILSLNVECTADVVRSLGVKFDKQALKTEGETQYQKTFNAANKDTPYLISNAAASDGVPVAKPEDQRGFHNYTAKIDNSSSLRPLGIEFESTVHKDSYEGGTKSTEVDYGVIEQSFERVCSMARLNSSLSCFGVFGVTCRRLWITWLKRRWVRSASGALEFHESLSLFLTDVDNLPTLWAMLTNEALVDRNVIFINPAESLHLHRYLSTMCPLPGFCRTIAIGASNAKVFSVSFPVLNNRGGLAINRNAKRVAIKIVLSDDEYAQEIQCLKRVCTTHPTDAKNFYAIGCMGAQDQESTYFSAEWTGHMRDLGIRTRDATEKSKASNYLMAPMKPWWLCEPSTELHGGVIIMRCGNHHSKLSVPFSLQALINDTTKWLVRIHAADVLHCDIRVRNIMYFPELTLKLRDETTERNLLGSMKRKEKEDEETTVIIDGGFQIIDFGLSECLKNSPSIAQDDAAAVGENTVSSDDNGLSAALMNMSLASNAEFSAKKTIPKAYGQYKDAGEAVKQAGQRVKDDKFEYNWKSADDWQMLLKAVTRCLKG
jgi:hypothetical protein